MLADEEPEWSWWHPQQCLYYAVYGVKRVLCLFNGERSFAAAPTTIALRVADDWAKFVDIVPKPVAMWLAPRRFMFGDDFLYPRWHGGD